jgi:hypothetical protein
VAEGGPLAVVQIPRTGSAAVSSAISNNYAQLQSLGKYQQDPQKVRATLETLAAGPGPAAVGGTVPFGLLRRYFPGGTRYVTVLSEPVNRVFTHYSAQAAPGGESGSADNDRIRSRWEDVLNAERAERDGPDQGPVIMLGDDVDLSLEAGLARGIPFYENLMTRFLWGGERLFGELPADALERAKENLAQFWFVAVGDRLDDSIVLLGRRLGVDGPMPYRSGTGVDDPDGDEPSPELRERIAKHNKLDLELYRFARERFEDTAPSPAELERDVDELRRRNIQFNAVREAERMAAKTAKVAGKTAKVAGKTAKVAAKNAKLASQNDKRAAKNDKRAAKNDKRAAKRAGTTDA